MPATFAAALCGFRSERGTPNTSDAHDKGSVELGEALFEVLGVAHDQEGPTDVGAAMEIAMVAELESVRPDLNFYRSRSAFSFEQYQHLSVFPTFKGKQRSVGPKLAEISEHVARSYPNDLRLIRKLLDLAGEVELQDQLIAALRDSMPEESLLKVDVTAGLQSSHGERLLLALSSKWSLRTDRAQDCVSQGAKLANQRRGSMPHYAVVTMEPRPAMLKLIADNSGAVDCVYHLDLPALREAIGRVRTTKPASWSPGLVFDRLESQRRLRDFDDLIETVRSMPLALN